MVRCFVGIMAPEGIREKIVVVQKQISNANIMCKMVEPENLHVSLSFLGEIEDINAVSDKLRDSVGGVKRFEVEVAGLLMIPNMNYVRVIALGVSDKAGLLESLRLKIRDGVGGDSHEAHLTLCRVKGVVDKRTFFGRIEKLEGVGIGKFEVDAVHLIKSDLSLEGPKYTVVESVGLE